MEEKKEIENFIKNYVTINLDVNGNLKCIYNSNNEKECAQIINALMKSKKLDEKFGRPDGYFYDNTSSFLYVFEHFEFDCSPKEEWGSKLRRNIKIASQEIDKELNSIPSGDYCGSRVVEQGYYEQAGDTKIYHVGRDGDKYRDNYWGNFYSVYRDHLEKLPIYKENCVKQINLTPSKLITAFVIEDITLGGTFYKEKNAKGNAVNLLETKQFLEVFKDSNLDFILFGSRDNHFLSVCSKSIIKDDLSQYVDLEKEEFFVLPSMVEAVFVSKE